MCIYIYYPIKEYEKSHSRFRSTFVTCVILSHQMELDDMLWQNTQDLCRPEALCALGRYPLLGAFANSTTKCPTAELKQAPHQRVKICAYNSIHTDTILYILTVLSYVITWSCMIYIYTYIYICTYIYIYCRIMYTHKISSLESTFRSSGSINQMAWKWMMVPSNWRIWWKLGDTDKAVDHHCGPLWTCVLPSGYVKIAIENGPVEIVDLPIKNGGSFHSYVTVDQRVPFTTMYDLSAGLTKDDILDSVNAHMFQDTSTRALRYSVTDSWKPGIQTCAPVWTSLKIHQRISTYFNSTKFGMRHSLSPFHSNIVQLPLNSTKKLSHLRRRIRRSTSKSFRAGAKAGM